MHLKPDVELTRSRIVSLQQYLDQVISSPVLRYSPELYQFLTASYAKSVSMEKPAPRLIPKADHFSSDKSDAFKVYDIEYPEGKINLMMNPKMRGITREIGGSIGDIQPLEKLAVKLCSEITDCLEKVSVLYLKLTSVAAKISRNYSTLKEDVKLPTVGQLASTYDGLREFIRAQSVIYKREATAFAEKIQGMFEFSQKELQGLQAVGVAPLTLSCPTRE
jgi:PX domain